MRLLLRRWGTAEREPHQCSKRFLLEQHVPLVPSKQPDQLVSATCCTVFP